MSNFIEERGINFTFNNDNFKKNVGDTINGLNQLETKVSGFEAKMNKGQMDRVRFFRGLQSVSGVNGLQGIADSVQFLANKFTTLGIVGQEVIRNLTNSVVNFGKRLIGGLITPLTTGGWNRALNIEQARFQLEGLFGDKTQKIIKDGKKEIVKVTDEIEANAMEAVKGTAYGFDASVRAASQLAASGVKAGGQMENALKGIAGMASMTGSSFEDMAQIFTTVSGNGRLMSEQLLQFSTRGLNAAVTLRDYLNKHKGVREKVIEAGLNGTMAKDVKEFANAPKLTEANVRSLVSGGAIDFKTFSKAMSDAFGAQAKKANNTFTGSLSNMKAALSRIGADVAIEQLKNLRDIFNSITPVIDKVHDALKPFIKDLNTKLKEGTNIIVTVFKTLNGVQISPEDAGLFTVFSIVNSIRYSIEHLLGLVERFKNIVGMAFKDVFGGSILSSVLSFTRTILNLVRSLDFGTRAAVNVKDTFKGLFTIIKIFGKILSPLLNLLFPIFDTGMSFIGLFFSITGAIGRFIVKIDEVATKLGIFEGITNTVVAVLRGFMSVWRALITGASDFLSGLGNTNRFGSAISKLKSHTKELGTLPDLITSIFNRISNGVSHGMKAITKALNEANFDPILDLFSAGALMTMAANLSKFIQKFTYTFFHLTGPSGDINQIKLAFEEFGGVLKGYQRSLNADALKSIAIAIAILVGSMLLLSSLDSQKLLEGVAAIGALLFELTTALKTMVAAEGKKGMATLFLYANLLKSMATSVLILAAAIRVIGTMKVEDMAKGVVAVAMLLKMLTNSVSELTKSKSDKVVIKGAAMMIAMAVAINLLAKAVGELGAMDLNTLGKGLGSIGALMLGLSLFMSHTKFDKGFGIKAGIGLLALSGSLVLMSKAVKEIGSLDSDSIVRGLSAIGAALFEISIFINIIQESKNILSSAALLASMALMVGQLAASFKVFGEMSWEKIGKGMVAVGGSLIIMAAALRLMGNASVLAGAVSILILSAAIKVLAPTLQMLGNMNLQQIGIALLAIAGGFAVLGAAAAILSPLIIPMLGLAAAVALLGIGIGALGAGLLAFSAGAGTFVAAITTILVGLSSVAGMIFDVIKAFLAEIVEFAPDFIKAGISIIKSFIKGITEELPGIALEAAALIGTFLDSLALNLPLIIEAAINFAISFLESLAVSLEQNADMLVDSIWNLCGAIATILIAAVHRIIPAAKQIGASIRDGIAKGAKNFGDYISKGLDRICKEIKALPGRIAKFLKQIATDFKNAGQNAVKGFVEGLKNAASNGIGAVGQFASNMIAKFKERLKIQSPSRVFYDAAVFTIKGVAKAYSQKGAIAYDEVKTFADTMASTVTNAISKVDDAVNNDYDFYPTITPVVDMSNVNDSTNAINSMFGSSPLGFNVPNGVRLAGTIAADLNNQNGGQNYLANQVSDLAKKLDSMTNSMNSRQLIQNNYIDGTADPNAFADQLTRRMKLNVRTM